MRARNKAPFSVPILSECKIGKSISLKKKENRLENETAPRMMR